MDFYSEETASRDARRRHSLKLESILNAVTIPINMKRNPNTERMQIAAIFPAGHSPSSGKRIGITAEGGRGKEKGRERGKRKEERQKEQRERK